MASASSSSSAGAQGGPPGGRGLVVWDFDWSMINENSDYYIVKKFGIVDDFKAKRRMPEFAVFTDLMHEQMRVLHDRGVRQAEVEACLSDIPVFPETVEAVRLLSQRGHEQIIVSDANSVFIDIILKAHGLEDIFPSHKIFTNPARWDDAQRLHVTWAHPKEQKPHECLFCTRNICKGRILKQHLGSYEQKNGEKRCDSGT